MYRGCNYEYVSVFEKTIWKPQTSYLGLTYEILAVEAHLALLI